MRHLRAQPSFVDTVFGAGGIMAQQFPGYEPRPGQVRMANAVAYALEAGEHLIVEAGTGVGKSRAYLVPVIKHVVGASQRAVIVTANIALQEQLATKDLPALQRELPVPFKFALLKGRANYVCKRRLDRVKREELQQAAKYDGGIDDEGIAALLAWCAASIDGDVSKAPQDTPPSVFSALTTSGQDCLGSVCPHSKTCHATQARSAANDAHVIVANYHLLFTDISVREVSERGVLPLCNVLVADELHRMAEIAREFASERVSLGSIKRLTGDALKLQHDCDVRDDVCLALEREAEATFECLMQYKRSPDYDVRLRRASEIDTQALCAQLDTFGAMIGGASGAGVTAETRALLARIKRRAFEQQDALQAASELRDANTVYFLDEQGSQQRKRVAVAAKPIDVAKLIGEGVFGRFQTVVGCSATIAVGNSFEHVSREIGAPLAKTSVLQVDSPFDLQHNALLVVPAGLSEPTSSYWPAEVQSFVAEAIQGANGRTLGLFTSNKNLQLVAQHLRACGIAQRYTVLVQGEAPRTQLVAQFRDDVHSVLLGTASFWEGVDVQGESLSCVVIDRLPFATPDDPILSVLRDNDPRGWFSSYSLPKAVIAFRQGFGRLIRSTKDRGCVVCLDRRLVDKSYGRGFVRSLGGVPIKRDIMDVAALFGNAPTEQLSLL